MTVREMMLILQEIDNNGLGDVGIGITDKDSQVDDFFGIAGFRVVCDTIKSEKQNHVFVIRD